MNSTSFSEINPSNLEQTQHDNLHYPFLPLYQAQDQPIPFEPLEGFSNFIEIDTTQAAVVTELHYFTPSSQQSGFINPSSTMLESQLSGFGGPRIDMTQQMDPMLFQTDQPNPLQFPHETLFPHPQEHALPVQQGEKRGRGRPRKHPLPDPSLPKRGKGRPTGARDSYKRLAKGNKSEMSRGQRLKEVLSRKAQRQEEIQGTASRPESQNPEGFQSTMGSQEPSNPQEPSPPPEILARKDSFFLQEALSPQLFPSQESFLSQEALPYQEPFVSQESFLLQDVEKDSTDFRLRQLLLEEMSAKASNLDPSPFDSSRFF